MFKCKACEHLKEENAYLKKLVDNLLSKSGVSPIVPQAEVIIEETEDEKADRALKEKGGQRYGD